MGPSKIPRSSHFPWAWVSPHLVFFHKCPWSYFHPCQWRGTKLVNVRSRVQMWRNYYLHWRKLMCSFFFKCPWSYFHPCQRRGANLVSVRSKMQIWINYYLQGVLHWSTSSMNKFGVKLHHRKVWDIHARLICVLISIK